MRGSSWFELNDIFGAAAGPEEGRADAGVRRSEEEQKNIEYGLGVARALAGFDIGQTVVVAGAGVRGGGGDGRHGRHGGAGRTVDGVA
jgi:hypothetical protein